MGDPHANATLTAIAFTLERTEYTRLSFQSLVLKIGHSVIIQEDVGLADSTSLSKPMQ